MRSKTAALGLALTVGLLGVSCGGNPDAPQTARLPSVTGQEPDGGVEASGRLTKQRWIVEDACADHRGTRVRLLDFTDGSRFPPHYPYWLVRNGSEINRVIECESSHQICLGAVQDPPPGIEWGVGMRGQHFPCSFPNRCCFSCTTLAHKLTLRCRSRISMGLSEAEDDFEGEVVEETLTEGDDSLE